ncbi:hypothetical protein J6590_020471 [Homalodisca vitripennis]|nr:hypothetical protein J6590_020471 [Homalodisca vitripennis]
MLYSSHPTTFSTFVTTANLQTIEVTYFDEIVVDCRSASPGRRSPPLVTPGEITLHLKQLKILQQPASPVPPSPVTASSPELSSLDTDSGPPSTQPSSEPTCQMTTLPGAGVPRLGLSALAQPFARNPKSFRPIAFNPTPNKVAQIAIAVGGVIEREKKHGLTSTFLTNQSSVITFILRDAPKHHTGSKALARNRWSSVRRRGQAPAPPPPPMCKKSSFMSLSMRLIYSMRINAPLSR